MNIKIFNKYIVVFLLSLLVLIGCGGNSGGDFTGKKGTSKIKLLSPTNKSIDYNYVTLEVKNNIADVKAKVNGIEYKGIKNGSSFYIYNVALKKGANKVELIANSGKDKLTVELNSQGKGYAPIGINVDKREGFEKLDTTLTIQTKLSVSKYLLDKDNDGVIDDDKTNNSFTLKYTKEGRYFPTATVKTSDGIWYSTQQNISLDVKAKPTEVKINGISEQINDLERFGGYIWALSNSNIYKIDENNESKITTINLSGVSSPQGFCYDDELNLYIVDSGNNRVVKLLASSNYQPDTYISQDGSFGTQGSGKGEFENPVDCMVDSTKDNEKIFIVDNGNNRIQIFNRAGIYINSFDGNNTINGKLDNPQGIVASSSIPIVVDAGNKIIRSFTDDGVEMESSTKVSLESPKKIFRTRRGYLIADNSKFIIIKIDLSGTYFEYKLNSSPKALISLNKANDNYYVAYENKNILEKLTVDSDAIGFKPEEIAQKYISAILKKDETIIKNLSSRPKLSNNVIKNINKWVDFLEKYEVKDYNLVFKDKEFSGVEVLFNKTTNRLQISLVNYYDQWYVQSL